VTVYIESADPSRTQTALKSVTSLSSVTLLAAPSVALNNDKGA
jgi:hypothetical protein